VPLLAAPAAGRQINRMGNLALVNLVLYVVTVVLIYSNAGTLKCPESSCLAADEKPAVNSPPRISLVLVYDAVLGLALFAALFFSCLPAVHAGEGYVGLLRAGRVADSILNHMLKNSVSGACALIEIELTDRCDSCAQRSGLCEVQSQLNQTVEWCVMRQVMVELSSGEYKTTASPANVEQLMKQWVLSTGHDKFTIEVGSQLTNSILLDEKMASIILQNTLTNAVAHGDGGNVEFTASLRDKGARKDH